MSELDPVLRCDSCQKLVSVKSIHQIGVCKGCGNKRFRAITTIDDIELKELKDMGYESFASTFDAIGEVED